MHDKEASNVSGIMSAHLAASFRSKWRHFALLSRLKYVVSQVKEETIENKYYTPFTTV